MKPICPIPPKCLETDIAILAKKGAGKTICAKDIAEYVLENRGRICAVDPTDVWWGLRSSADGKKPGFPVVIFGGRHADIPIGAQHGAALAELVGKSAIPAIISTKLMTVGERTRFFADFAETLLRVNEGVLHLFIDECHNFMPQGKILNPESGRMLHAANNLVSEGRSQGLRITMISQRPAKVHKDSLTQVETLITLRMISPQDRAAIREWVGEWYDDQEEARKMIAGLAALPTGTGWLWAPEIGKLEKMKFPMIKTFDSSSTPKAGAARANSTLAAIDMADIQKRLGSAAETIRENDPKTLRAELAKLRRERDEERKHPLVQPVKDEAAISQAYKIGFDRGIHEGLITGRFRAYEDAQQAVHTAKINWANGATGPMTAIKTVFPDAPVFVGTSEGMKELKNRPGTAKKRENGRDSVLRTTDDAGAVHKVFPIPETNASIAPSTIGSGETKVLVAIAQAQGRATREYISIMTGYKCSSRNAYIQRLRSAGLILINSQGQMIETETGRAALGDFTPLPTGAALRQWWLSQLPKGEADVLGLLFGDYPDGRNRESISEVLNLKSSSRNAYIQRLRSRQLVEPTSDGIRAVERLYA